MIVATPQPKKEDMASIILFSQKKFVTLTE